MRDEFLKPPSLAVWLWFSLCAASLAEFLFGGPFDIIAGWLILSGGLLALWAVCRWAGRWIGFAAGNIAREFAIGVEQGRADARRKREEQLR